MAKRYRQAEGLADHDGPHSTSTPRLTAALANKVCGGRKEPSDTPWVGTVVRGLK